MITHRLPLAGAALLVALGIATSAHAGGRFTPSGDASAVQVPAAPGTWDSTYRYSVNGRPRTCVLTRGARCVGARLRGRVTHHGDLRRANLRKADLRFADLRGANLAGADLRGANLRFADLRGANLTGARIQALRAPGRSANGRVICTPTCEGGDAAGHYFIRANMVGVNLTGANLTGAHMQYANLWQANLQSVIAVGTDFMWANLSNTDFTGANLTGANLFWAATTVGIPIGGVTWSNTACPMGGRITGSPCPSFIRTA